ncbi:outer membrane protein assembly factor BamA [Cypionkella sp.]|jgi:outer membrane protein insertion porin family|uniref:outer membrane protein assembly factor BamA n=1 Tax=Cypionkella sp. TaxID=2811411 RepID=UPI0027466B51|nr:outer membrane protein assembly factor BamA [Cypionkella sp.]
MLATSGAKTTGLATSFRRVRPALVAVLLSSAMVSAPFLTQAVAQSYSFAAVKIEGNSFVDAATILSYAGITRGASISAGDLNDAYQRIVASGLFESVELQPSGGTLVIKVVEYPTINIVDFQGNKRIKDDKLTEIIKSKERLVYSPAQAETDAASIAEAYRVQGRLAASVDPKIIRRSNNRVDLVFNITEGKVVENEKISIVGNRAFSDRRLRQVLQTKQAGFLRQLIKSDTFIPERLEADKQTLRDFYLSRGYIDVQVLDAQGQLSRERDATFVTYTLREGKVFSIGKISTVSAIEGVDAADFAAVQRGRTGAIYSPVIIDNNITRMENLAVRKGLNFVRIEPRLVRNDRDQTLDVEYVILRADKVFVERIDIEGNTTTLDQVVRRQFRTSEGDAFNPREIKQAAERIRNLGFFEDAAVDTKPGSNADQVIVNVDVIEKPTGSISFGVSYGTSSGVGLNFGFSESNFLGRGQGLALNISSGTSTVDSSISFVEPALLGRDLKFKLNAGYNTTNNDNAYYDTQKISFIPALEFPVAERSRLELRYKLFQDTISNINPGSTALSAEQGGKLGSGLGYTFSFDSRLSGISPTSYTLLRFGQDFLGFGGDVKYVETNALAVAETKIFKEELAVRAIFEGGMINSYGNSTTRVTDRFFGAGKIRGFEGNGFGPRDLGSSNLDALGGNKFAVVRLEADFPLGLPEEYGMKGGAFFDMGSVWGSGNGAAGATDSAHLRSVVGASLLWDTPVGPLRFNFTKAIKKETYDKEQKFDLTIQTSF